MSDLLSPDELEQLMRRHSPALRLFAAQWTNSADDAVQESFIRLMAQSSRPSNVVAWLYRVVRNRAISMSRSTRRRRNHESQVADKSWFVGPPQQGVDAEELSEAMSGLEQTLREIVIARIWGGLGFAELAEVLGVSTATAHRRYQQALGELRERLEQPCLSKNETI